MGIRITSGVHAFEGTSRRAVMIFCSKSFIEEVMNMVRVVRMMAKISEYQKATMTMRSTPIFLFANH